MGIGKKNKTKKENKSTGLLEQEMQDAINLFTVDFEVFKESILLDDFETQKRKVKEFWTNHFKPSFDKGVTLSYEGLELLWDRCGVLHSYRLTKEDFDKMIGKKNKFYRVVDYARLTFILSLIGFLGSIGFYLGVLRQVYSPTSDKHEIRILKAQNEKLQNTVNVLSGEIESNNEFKELQ